MTHASKRLNHHSLAIALILALPSFSGCAPTPAALKEVDRARVDYEKSSYRTASTKLNRFIGKYGQHADSAEAYYLRSLCGAKLSNHRRAESDARSCIRLSRNDALTTKARATLATLLFESKQTAEALDHFDAALQSLPDEPPADLLRYRYGICLQREGRWQEARSQFAKVYQKFPRSTLVGHARRMHDWPHDYFSIQCGAFRDRTQATSLSSRLRRSGLNNRVEVRPRGGQYLHTVFVGRYSTLEDAKSGLSSVRRQVSDAHVVP